MREKIKLESSAGTGHFYTTNKNKRTTPEKIEIKKFDPVGVAARNLQECLLIQLRSEGLVDEVIRQLMSGKEATVYIVRCGEEIRCAKVYKDLKQRSFRNNTFYIGRGLRAAVAAGKATSARPTSILSSTASRF